MDILKQNNSNKYICFCVNKTTSFLFTRTKCDEYVFRSKLIKIRYVLRCDCFGRLKQMGSQIEQIILIDSMIVYFNSLNRINTVMKMLLAYCWNVVFFEHLKSKLVEINCVFGYRMS